MVSGGAQAATYGCRSGGKVLKRRQTAAINTPYDRPTQPLPSPSQPQSFSWLNGLVFHAKCVANGVTEILSPVWSSSSSSSSSGTSSSGTGSDSADSGEVNVARAYMQTRPPWVSPLSPNYSPTTSPFATDLSKGYSSVGGNSFRSAKRDYQSAGFWNIQEEIRRVRAKTTEDLRSDHRPGKIASSTQDTRVAQDGFSTGALPSHPTTLVDEQYQSESSIPTPSLFAHRTMAPNTEPATDGRRSGGKFLKRRPTVAMKTPYDRPTRPLPSPSQPQSPSWLSGLVFHSKCVASGVIEIFSPIWSPSAWASTSSSSSSSSGTGSDSEDGVEDDYEDNENPSDGFVELNQKKCSSSGKSETLHLIEQLLMREQYSREECDRLVSIINSRVIDYPMSDGVDARSNTPEIRSQAITEAEKQVAEKKVASSSKEISNAHDDNLVGKADSPTKQRVVTRASSRRGKGRGK